MSSFTYGIGTFAAYFVAVVVLLRLPNALPARAAVLAAVAVYPAGLIGALLLGKSPQFWYFSSSYAFLTMVFLMIFGAVYKSISLRILLDLLNRPGHSDSYEATLKRYILKESFEHRLDVILDNGYAVRSDGGFELTGKGRRLASTIRRIQQVFGMERSG